MPQDGDLILIKFSFKPRHYSAVWIIEVGEMLDRILMASHEIIAIVGDLLFGMGDGGRGLATPYDGLCRALDLDNQIAIVGTADDKIRIARSQQVWLRPNLDGHRIEKSRVRCKKLLEFWLIIRMFGDQRFELLEDGFTDSKPSGGDRRE
jgi:hypothetical protein